MPARIPRLSILQAAHNSPVSFLYQTRTLAAAFSQCYPVRKTRPRLHYYSTSNGVSSDNFSKESSSAQASSQEGYETTATATPESATNSAKPEDDGRHPWKGYIHRRAASVSQGAVGEKKDDPEALQTMTQRERQVFGDILANLGPDLLSQRRQQQQQQQEEQQRRRLNRRQRKEQRSQEVEDTGAGPISETREQRRRLQQEQPQLSADDVAEISQISSIFEAVLKDGRRPQRGELDGEDPTGKDTKKNEAAPMMKRYVPISNFEAHNLSRMHERLRRFKYSDMDVSVLSSNDQMPMEKAIELVVQRESEKLESALVEAVKDGRGDLGVWQVCKEHIFSMMQYMDDENVQKGEDGEEKGEYRLDSTIPEHKHRSRQEDQDITVDAVGTETEAKGHHQEIAASPIESEAKPTPTILEIPPFVSTKPVINALYPRMLLVAFRLLSTNYPTSPLATQFSSSIRARGRSSSVAGSSTALYNELLYFHWRDGNDLRGVVSLLREMDETGVEPDLRTMSLLRGIVRQRGFDIKRFWARRRGDRKVGIEKGMEEQIEEENNGEDIEVEAEERKEGKKKADTEGEEEEKENPDTRKKEKVVIEKPVIPWWRLGANRKAFAELVGFDGHEGWIHILQARFSNEKRRGELRRKEFGVRS